LLLAASSIPHPEAAAKPPSKDEAEAHPKSGLPDFGKLHVQIGEADLDACTLRGSALSAERLRVR
jgi:hypothetical protein